MVSQSVSRNQSVGKQLVKREEKSVLKRNYLLVLLELLKTLGATDQSIYPLEGLYTPKPIPNLDIKSSGPIYPTIYLPYLSCYPLTTSKTPNSSLSLK